MGTTVHKMPIDKTNKRNSQFHTKKCALFNIMSWTYSVLQGKAVYYDLCGIDLRSERNICHGMVISEKSLA